MPDTCCLKVWFPDRIDIQQDSSSDGDAEPDFTGDVFAESVPCRVIDTGGDETFRGRQLEPHISHVVEMRYLAGVLQTMRLRVTKGIHADRIFNIQYPKIVRERGSAPMLWLYCKEVGDT